jgi:hypothetical protein
MSYTIGTLHNVRTVYLDKPKGLSQPALRGYTKSGMLKFMAIFGSASPDKLQNDPERTSEERLRFGQSTYIS